MRIAVALIICMIFNSVSYSQYDEPDNYYEMDTTECLSLAESDAEVLLCNKINDRIKQYPRNFAYEPKYSVDGHLYTTFIVLKAAGVNEDRLYDIAYCSQLPDDNIWFSATVAAFYLDTEHRNNIMEVVHSLHGGGDKDVRTRRSKLKAIISNALMEKNLTDCELGIIVHAYADAYAHTYEKNGHLQAYAPPFGHLWHGHKPDIIAYYPDKFTEYTEELFSVFNVDSTKRLPFAFTTFAQNLSDSRKLAYGQMQRFALREYNYDFAKMEAKENQWKSEISMDEFKELMSYIIEKL